MSRTARRLGLAVAGVGFAALAGFATASPAAADNGPHVALTGNVAMADGCAGCHRIHNSQGDTYVLKASSVSALCETCHAGGTGATTNVVDGVSTQESSTVTAGLALRAGGFSHAANGAATAQSKNFGYSVSAIPADTAVSVIGSSHQLETAQTVWGSGAIGSTGKANVVLECTSCHDPHGNGNYRILRPVGVIDNAVAAITNQATNVVKQLETVTAVSSAVDPMNSAKFAWTFTTADTSTFLPGQMVTVRGSGSAGTSYVASANVAYSGTNSFTVMGQTAAFDSATLTGVYATTAFSTSIVSASADGTTETLTTAAYLGLIPGQKVTIAVATGGIGGATATKYTATLATVLTVNNVTTYDAGRNRYNGTRTIFTIAAAATTAVGSVGIEGGLYIAGIPDAINADASTVRTGGYPVGKAGYMKVYTTNDYWMADDRYATGEFQALDITVGSATKAVGVASPYITSVSQWCATCHTRYLASDSKSRTYANTVNGVVDTNFQYRHTSGTSKVGGPNCVQCHVAHGTTATVTAGGAADDVTFPGTATKEGSALLRVNNRGVCLLCHNPYVTQ
jgi:predicted CXXCH cytochrome family protein